MTDNTHPQTSTELATAFVEEAHARLSPSGSKKWFACPGSITLEEPIPNKSSTYADDGTAMHAVASECLETGLRAQDWLGDYVRVNAAGEPERKVRFTDDMVELTQGYVDLAREIARGNEMLVEQRVEFSEFVGVPNQFGTVDLGVVDLEMHEIRVLDLKTGHRPVDVDRNSQLMLYALGLLAKLRDNAKVDDLVDALIRFPAPEPTAPAVADAPRDMLADEGDDDDLF